MGSVASSEVEPWGMRKSGYWTWTLAAVMETLLSGVPPPPTRWITHRDTARWCSAESHVHFLRSLCPPAAARERCSVLSWWSVPLRRSPSRTTMATTDSTLRPGELVHQTNQAGSIKTHVTYYPDFHSVKELQTFIICKSPKRKKGPPRFLQVNMMWCRWWWLSFKDVLRCRCQYLCHCG